MNVKFYPIFSLLFLIIIPNLYAQRANTIFWQNTEQSQKTTLVELANSTIRRVFITQNGLLELREHLLQQNKNQLTTLSLPLPNGTDEVFLIQKTAVLSTETAIQFPNIQTYQGISTQNPSHLVRITLSDLGLYAMMLHSTGTIYIQPEDRHGSEAHICYYQKDYQTQVPPSCGLDASDSQTEIQQLNANKTLVGDCQLRTYRMAVAATGEYVNWAGSQANAATQITATVNNIIAIYQRDANIQFTLILNNALLFTNASTDPYPTLGFPDAAYLNTNHATLVGVLGTTGFDIGHVFSAEWNGGLAQRPAVCSSTGKGRAASGVAFGSGPTGAIFESVVAHETAHQINVSHTHGSINASCAGGNSSPSSAWEPGGGSTIMAYAGVCTGNSYQNNSDLYFHAGSINQMVSYALTTTCATLSSTNSAPTLTAPALNYNIPVLTPFTLTATGSDANGDPLSFSWEQMDAGTSSTSPSASATSGPNFRSFPPTNLSSRTFPSLSSILTNTSPTYEVLPGVARSMNFRGVVRDNHTGGGCTGELDVVVNTSGSSAFAITSHNSATSLTANGTNTTTITWDVSGSDVAPVSCANVAILFSTDGGQTFPYTLLSATANDGTETIIVPSLPTTIGRIKVKCSDNVFFDINNADITILSSCAANASNIAPTAAASGVMGNSSLDLNLAPQYGTLISSPIVGTLTSADPTGGLTIYSSVTTSCAYFGGNAISYDLVSFQVNIAGVYTFTEGTGNFVLNLYTNNYVPSSPCTNFITSNSVYNGSSISINSSVSATLSPGINYVFLVSSFNTGNPVLPAAYSIAISPPAGGNLFTGIPNPGASFNYTYLMVNTGNGKIAAINTSSDLSGITETGLYNVYGLSYSNTLTLASLNAYVGQSFSSLQNDLFYLVFCGSLSTNNVAVTITCPSPDRSFSICPRQSFVGETSTGKGNLITNWSGASPLVLAGNDVLYEITIAGNAPSKISVWVNNLSADAELLFTGNNCGSGTYTQRHSLSASSLACEYDFTISAAGTYYICIDHNNGADITYDIAFAGITGTTTVNVPDTRGVFKEDVSLACGPYFKATNPSFDLIWNGVSQSFPLTLAPLNTSGVLCVNQYLKNATGDEGFKKVEFDFGTDLASIQTVNAANTIITSMTGLYNTGNWQKTSQIVNGLGHTIVTWEFFDAAGTGRGDFDGNPNTCLTYPFCFRLTPLSNNPSTTKVIGTFYPDGWGTGTGGNVSVSSGCCVNPGSSCCLPLNIFLSPSAPFTIDFEDPAPVPLPVQLLAWAGEAEEGANLLHWTTIQEQNNHHFEIERSEDELHYHTIAQIPAYAASQYENHYEYKDANPIIGKNFYRLKQIDINGQGQTFSTLELLQIGKNNPFSIYPNPSHNQLFIQAKASITDCKIQVFDITGKIIIEKIWEVSPQKPYALDVSTWIKGVYFIRVIADGYKTEMKFLKN